MNKLDKLTEATMKALQTEEKSLGIKYNGLEVVTGTGDQGMFESPLLIKKGDNYIWVDLFWDELDDMAHGNRNDAHLQATYCLDDDDQPIQEDEQYDFIDRDITLSDLEAFEGEESNIEGVLIEFAKYEFTNTLSMEGKEPEEGAITATFVDDIADIEF